jgi:hypothetical protein
MIKKGVLLDLEQVEQEESLIVSKLFNGELAE